MEKLLSGIRVVELGTHIAVPLAARTMADWGADVIKIEPPQGEAYRTMGRPFKIPYEEDYNVLYQPMNANKKSICIDLKSKDGIVALRKLLATADVFITNTRPNALARLGVDYESIQTEFPKLIYAHFSGYGAKGPDKDLPGFDGAAFWARVGEQLEWSLAGERPVKPWFGFGDAASSTPILSAVLASLYQRERTGKGEFVQGSLFATSLWYNLHGVIMAQPQFGHKYPKSMYEQQDPTGILYQTSDDEWFMIVEAAYDQKIAYYFDFLGLPELKDDVRLNNLMGAQKNVKLGMDYLIPAFKKKTAAEVTEFLTKLGTVHERLRNPIDAYTDEQAWANDYLDEVTFQNGKKVVMPTVPVSFASMSKPEVNLAPLLGANSEEILLELGYSQSEVDDLNEKRVVIKHK